LHSSKGSSRVVTMIWRIQEFLVALILSGTVIWDVGRMRLNPSDNSMSISLAAPLPQGLAKLVAVLEILPIK
jgi:hypothetical protein